jgi:NAD(P)-dependent dehydrogenase (short-subunit alcohol dehydrogenase family)
MTREPRVAVVTGGNRGLALETCRQLNGLGYYVVLTGRDAASRQGAAERLRRARGGLTGGFRHRRRTPW